MEDKGISDGGICGMNFYSQQLLCGLSELRQRQLLCDVVLIANDAKVHAHRVVLAGCSPYFRAMFTGNLAEKDKQEIEMQSIDSLALRTVIEYAYSGSVLISQQNVQSLLPAANLLQLNDLLHLCCSFLESQLHPSNCIGIWKFAEAHSCFDLYEKAFNYMLQNFSEVTTGEEFKELTVEEVCDVMCQDDLSVPTEETVLQAAEAWFQYRRAKRGSCLSDLLHCVRLWQIPLRTLNKFLDTHQHIMKDLMCRKLVQETLSFKLDIDRRLNRQKSDCLSCKPRCSPKALCAVGGKSGLFATLSSVEVFFIPSGMWTDVPPMSVCRSECGVTALNSKLYVLGGIASETRDDGTYRYHDDQVECWDPESNCWHDRTPMLHRRSAFAVTAFHGELFALGGYDGHSYHRTMEKYCPQTNKWEECTPMKQCRSCFCASSLEGYVYAVGGYGPPCLNSVEKYDPLTEEWEFVRPMVEKRINFGVGVACGCLFVVGGHNGTSYLSSVERYDPITDQWTNVTGIGRPRTGLSVCVLDSVLYAVGGHSGSAYLRAVQKYDPHEDLWEDEESMATCRSSFGLTAL